MPPSIARDVANGVLQGVAGGTFLYITFFEVLPHEFSSNRSAPLTNCHILFLEKGNQIAFLPLLVHLSVTRDTGICENIVEI